MRRAIGFLLGVVCICACARQEGFVVQGKIDGYESPVIFVREMTPDNEEWINDTITVTDSRFEYRGVVESPRLIYFIPQDFRGRYELFLENSKIEVKAEDGSFGCFQAKGSSSHDEYVKVCQESAELQMEYGYYEQRKNRALQTDQELYLRLADSAQVWSVRFLDFLKQCPNYPDSKVLSYFAYEWIKSEDVKGMESYLDGLSQEARMSVYVQYCERILEQERRVLPGNMAYDFTLQDTSGKVYRLSDFRGEYVLLEFSASWCGWCKLEIPYLKKVYDLSRDKRLVMLTINMDKERKLWVDDVAKDALPWPVLSDLTAFDGEIAKQYSVRGIPIVFLIDPEGRIVTNKLRGDAMVRYIDQLLHSETETLK